MTRAAERVGPGLVLGRAAAGLALWALAVAAGAAERVALVIGNSAYEHVPFLPNPGNDARDVGAALDRLGFEVSHIANAGKAELRQGLHDFARAASASEVAVVFYAGHGIEVDGSNFLVPVDARLQSDQDVEFETVRLELVLLSVKRARGLRLVILDACRDNPFAKSMERAGATRSIGRGLARKEPQGETLLAYAAEGGSVAADGGGRNSPYTAALLRYLEEPGLDVGRMFRKVRDAVLTTTGGRQEPFVYGSMPGRDVYLASAAAPPPPPPPPPGGAKAAYEEAKVVDTPAAYRIVVKRFPGTIEAELAQARIDKHERETLVVAGGAPEDDVPPAAPSPEEVEKGLRLSREARRLVQVGLAGAGYAPGPADGRFRAQTRAALRSWQGSKRREATGYLTKAQGEELTARGREVEAKSQREAAERGRAEAERKAREATERRRAKSKRKAEEEARRQREAAEQRRAYEEGLRLRAEAKAKRERKAREAEEAARRAQEAALTPKAVDQGLGLSREERRLVQMGLAAAGHSPGSADGVFGPQTRKALRAWQASKELEGTGYLTREQSEGLAGLGREEAERRREAEAERKRKAEAEEAARRARAEAEERRLAEAERKRKARAAEEAARRARAEAERKEREEEERRKRARRPGDTFEDCLGCPEMVVVPEGTFRMGSPESEEGRWDDGREGPVHPVTIGYRLAVGVNEVTRGEFARFVSATGRSMGDACWSYESGEWKERSGRHWRNPGFSQTDDHPVVCVDWDDAKAYAEWLSGRTGQKYRLLSEAEWEYVARAGTETARYWGEGESGQCRYANGADETYGWSEAFCDDGHASTSPVGHFRANGYKLHDVLGNVWEWTEDCWNESYRRAPRDGSAWTSGNCGRRALRGGSWSDVPGNLRSAFRGRGTPGNRSGNAGFRVARTLTP